jgi:hypothetical protein
MVREGGAQDLQLMKAGELKIHIRNEVETYVLAVA